MSTITWNSLLLSKGSIFTFTSLNATSEHASSNSTTTPPRNIQRRDTLSSSGFMIRR